MEEREKGSEKCCIPGCSNDVVIIMARGMGEGLGGAWRHTTVEGGYMELTAQVELLEIDYSGRPTNIGDYVHRGHVCPECTAKIVGNIKHVWDLRNKKHLETFITSQERSIAAIQSDTDRARRELFQVNERLR